MENSDVLMAILAAEKRARERCVQADALRDGADKRIQQEKDRLRLKYQDEADRAAAEAQERQRARADAETDAVKAAAEARLALMRKKYEAEKRGYVDKIFSLATGAPADER